MKKITLLLLLCFLFFQSQAQNQVDLSFIHSIYFGGGSYYIDYQQIRELNEFLDRFKGIEQYEIIIHSHTDDIGSLEYNARLSKMRSWATLQELLRRGLSKDLIRIEDYGELNPIYDNSTREGKLRNRRVDVILKPPIT